MNSSKLSELENRLTLQNRKLEEDIKLLSAKKESLKLAQEVGHFGSWEIDLETRKSIWSKKSYEIYGLTPGSFEPTLDLFLSLVIEEDREKAIRSLERCKDGNIHSDVVRVVRADGEIISLLINGKYIFDDNGRPKKFIGTTLDVTEELKLKQENKELASIVEDSQSEIYILEKGTGRYLYANKIALESISYKKEELYSMTIFDINKSLTHDIVGSIESILMHSGSTSSRTTHTRKDGSSYTVEAHLYAGTYQNKDVVIAFDIDITEQIKAEEKLHAQSELMVYQAHHDALTGLPNKLLFNKELEKAIEKEDPFMLMFIDLDSFKQVNDIRGHSYGDAVLKIMSKQILASISTEDRLFRFGGDEFIVLSKNHEQAENIAMSILSSFEHGICHENHTFNLSASIGISRFPSDANGADELLRYADMAMYHAKSLGKNNYQFFTQDIADEMLQSSALEKDIRSALEKDEFTVHYQPQIDMSNGRNIGVEALIRWNHPTKGTVMPDSFIPFAEKSGLIKDIGRFVILQSMKDMIRWKSEGVGIDKVAINMSILELSDINFASTVNECAAETNFDLSWLELEITEREIMQNHDICIDTLRSLMDMGISIAMDDFGTGYSSLAYLKDLPIDKLKIDRSFLTNVPGNIKDEAIIKTIITLGRNLNLRIIAEGVETIEQSEFLLDNNCLLSQGYYFARPMSADAISSRLSSIKI